MKNHKILCVIVLAAALAGCCGAGAGAQSFSAAPSAAPQASSAVSTGCRLKGGLECGGVSLFGLDVQFPDPFTVGGMAIRSLTGGASAQAASDGCTPSSCGVPE